jgi:hypothetical protein
MAMVIAHNRKTRILAILARMRSDFAFATTIHITHSQEHLVLVVEETKATR